MEKRFPTITYDEICVMQAKKVYVFRRNNHIVVCIMSHHFDVSHFMDENAGELN